MKTQNTTKSKKVYVDKWNNYIDGLNLLLWVNSKDLHDKVKSHIDEIRALLPKIASDKGLK
jgi:hypothetical protein